MKKILFLFRYLYLFTLHIIQNNLLKKININSNNECIVLGNGPSLNISIKEHLSFFHNKSVLAVNNFVISDIFEKIKPEFYIVSDSGFWETKYINKNNDTNINSNINRLKNINFQFVDNLIKKVDWRLNLFFPIHAKGSETIKSIIDNNSNIKVHYYAMNPINLNNKLGFFLYKYNFGMPTSQTVLISAIFIALNLNFKKIYLLGGDHSWHEDFFVNNDNILYTKDKHFYDNGYNLIPIISNGKNHSKIHDEFLSLYKAFKGHILLEWYSKYLGAKIYNASEKTYIDAYERFEIKK